MVNHVKSQAARTFQIQRTVVDKNALLRRALRHFQRDAENGLLRLARTHIARAEENHKIPPQVERLDAVLIQLERLVVDRTNKIFSGPRGIRKNSARIGIFLGLREHKSSEVFAGKRAVAVKESAVEIFIQSDLPGIESGKRKIVAVLKFLVVELKSGSRLAA